MADQATRRDRDGDNDALRVDAVAGERVRNQADLTTNLGVEIASSVDHEVAPGNGTSGLIGNGAGSVVVDGDDDEETETED